VLLQGENPLPTPFTSILCGVEGNPASTEAARQAIALAETGGDLQFTAVYTSFELGPDYHKDALESSLEEAARLAAEAGVSASYELREAKYAIDVLLPESRERDLLVIGTHGNSRTSGILFGSTASEAAHGAERPLLIAREAPGESPFPKDILVASDGTPGSWEPVRAAAKLAASFDAKLDVVYVEDGKHDLDEETLGAQLAEIAEATGREPELDKPDGHATKEIVETAKAKGSSLIVAGRRGARGLKSLGSVSERIVGGAACSVLLIPVSDGA
jgi:nucleotide-binding universal stress UspA family protein